MCVRACGRACVCVRARSDSWSWAVTPALCSLSQSLIASVKCHIEKHACVKSFLLLLSHIFTNSHIDSLSFPHSLECTPLHTHTRPHGEWCLHKCPLFPPPAPPFSHSLSLDSFSDMPAQAHLAAHALPLHFPYLPPPFTFLPCGISMATWKETSVLGEQCDEVGCFGWGGRQGLYRVEGAEDKEAREGSEGVQYAHPGRPQHR